MIRFDPSEGAEIRKIRPAVVLSVDKVGRLPLRIVVPLTDWQAAFVHLPWFVHLPVSAANALTKESGADAFQVKSVSETRFVRYVGSVDEDELEDVASAVAMCVGAA